MVVNKMVSLSGGCYYSWCWFDTSNAACSPTSFTTTTNYSPISYYIYYWSYLYEFYFPTANYLTGTTV